MAKDYTDVRFGKVVGVSCVGKRNSQVIWRWRCDCGNEFERVAAHFIRTGSGCCPDCIKPSNLTHGMARTKEYISWLCIKGRCFDKANPFYCDYGAVGITMQEEFKDSFEVFFLQKLV